MANGSLMQTRFGSREICNVTLKAKGQKKIGNKTFQRGEPVFIFDSLKTSSLESGTTTVYATGGRGNTRLIAWEGEKTVTFTMEDALISPLTFSILSGSGLEEYSDNKVAKVHFSEIVKCTNAGTIDLKDVIPAVGANATGGLVDPGEEEGSADYYQIYAYKIDEYGNMGSPIEGDTSLSNAASSNALTILSNSNFSANEYYLIDAYAYSYATVLTVDPDSFAGSYYIEADTLFRRESDSADLPAQFIIPHGKIQSNYTFSMASTGDPSTFTFTVDAFPDYVQFDRSRKVLFALNILS